MVMSCCTEKRSNFVAQKRFRQIKCIILFYLKKKKAFQNRKGDVKGLFLNCIQKFSEVFYDGWCAIVIVCDVHLDYIPPGTVQGLPVQTRMTYSGGTPESILFHPMEPAYLGLPAVAIIFQFQKSDGRFSQCWTLSQLIQSLWVQSTRRKIFAYSFLWKFTWRRETWNR